jgi:ribosomal protein S6
MQEEILDVENTGKNDENRVYELGYLLLPSITEENVPASYGNLKELIASLRGEVISDEMPKFRELAYQMEKVVSNVRSKYNTAYFGWVKFYMEPNKVTELKKKLDLSPELIRFLIIKTVKENTIAAKRFIGRDTRRPRMTPTHKAEEGDAPAAPINKEEIDKEIEAMVAN